MRFIIPLSVALTASAAPLGVPSSLSSTLAATENEVTSSLSGIVRRAASALGLDPASLVPTVEGELSNPTALVSGLEAEVADPTALGSDVLGTVGSLDVARDVPGENLVYDLEGHINAAELAIDSELPNVSALSPLQGGIADVISGGENGANAAMDHANANSRRQTELLAGTTQAVEDVVGGVEGLAGAESVVAVVERQLPDLDGVEAELSGVVAELEGVTGETGLPVPV